MCEAMLTCEHVCACRSYVVRHIRDTHRDKAMAVIDLVETGEIEADAGDLDESVDSSMDVSKTDDMGDSVDKGTISNSKIKYKQ